MERCIIGRTLACLAGGKSQHLRCLRAYKDVSLAFPGKIKSSVMFLQVSQVCSTWQGAWLLEPVQQAEHGLNNLTLRCFFSLVLVSQLLLLQLSCASQFRISTESWGDLQTSLLQSGHIACCLHLVNECKSKDISTCENADLQFHATVSRVGSSNIIYFTKALFSNIMHLSSGTRPLSTCLSHHHGFSCQAPNLLPRGTPSVESLVAAYIQSKHSRFGICYLQVMTEVGWVGPVGFSSL